MATMTGSIPTVPARPSRVRHSAVPTAAVRADNVRTALGAGACSVIFALMGYLLPVVFTGHRSLASAWNLLGAAVIVPFALVLTVVIVLHDTRRTKTTDPLDD